MKLSNLFTRKSEIDRKLAERKSAAVTAARALELCDRLAETLPARIAEHESLPIEIGFSSYGVTEDFAQRTDLLRQKSQCDAARAVLADLPKIRAHWEGVAAGR